MISHDPTQDDLNTTHRTLNWYRNYLEEHKPYALNVISALDDVLDHLPTEEDELNSEEIT